MAEPAGDGRAGGHRDGRPLAAGTVPVTDQEGVDGACGAVLTVYRQNRFCAACVKAGQISSLILTSGYWDS